MISNSGTSTLGLYDLKRQIDAFGGVDYFRPNLAGGYLKNARVMLDNGDIVKSTVANNIVDPNIDMTGWVASNANKTQYLSDYSTLQDAVDDKRGGSSSLTVEAGGYAQVGSVNLSGFYHLVGRGDAAVVSFEGAGNGIKYVSQSGVHDDHAQRSLKDFRIHGDGGAASFLNPSLGTTTGFSFAGLNHRSRTSGMSFDRHKTGMYVENAYTCFNTYNQYRANDVGLHLKGVTSFREESIYARYNSVAAVLIEGAGTQNITLDGGAIEGNRGRGIWLRDVPAGALIQVQLDDLYMESCGDLANNVPSVDIQQLANCHVSVRGGNYWHNTTGGVTSGVYKWGNSVSFEGSSLAGYHYAKYMSFDKCTALGYINTHESLSTSLAVGLSEPAVVTQYEPHNVPNAMFCGVFDSKIPSNTLYENKAKLTYPHLVQQSPTVQIQENTSLDFGDGSWTDVTFLDSGNYGSNYAELFVHNTLVDKQYSAYTFLLKPTADIDLGFVGSNGGTFLLAYYKFKAGKTYKVNVVGNNSINATSRIRMFSLSAGVQGSVAFKPFTHMQFTDKDQCLKWVDTYCL